MKKKGTQCVPFFISEVEYPSSATTVMRLTRLPGEGNPSQLRFRGRSAEILLPSCYPQSRSAKGNSGRHSDGRPVWISRTVGRIGMGWALPFVPTPARCAERAPLQSYLAIE